MMFQDKFREIDRKKIIQAAKRSLKKEEGKKAWNHLLNDRKLKEETIDKFDFGYCPEHIEHQLKDRLITPFYDEYGNIIAITSRYIEKDRKNRFWHESFDKGSYLYGLNLAKQHIFKCQKAILVEGEMDVAVLHNEGFDMTVGVCGSAFTLSQIAKLSRICSEIYLMFDGDTSGKSAIYRALDVYKKNYLSAYDIKFIPVFLDKQRDPDEYLREEGKDAFKELLVLSKKNTMKVG